LHGCTARFHCFRDGEFYLSSNLDPYKDEALLTIAAEHRWGAMDLMAPPSHLDGSACLEGTQRVPRGYVSCCEDFRQHTLTCYHDIRYEWWSTQRRWFTIISPAAGGGGVAIAFCPHCGKKL
jgi:hypothetical protein